MGTKDVDNMQEAEKPIDLYTYAMSPYGMKVYWALIFKGADFNIHYVNPTNFDAIKFTNQTIVPVLKIGDEWRLDSGPLCEWLEEYCPDKPYAGSNDAERDAIREADDWVTKNLIALLFRTCLDRVTLFSTLRTANKLSNIMCNTSGMPRWMRVIWPFGLKSAGFIIDDANALDRTVSIQQNMADITQEFDEHLSSTGYIAGTEKPSYADLAAFAQLCCTATIEFEGTIRPNASPAIEKWYSSMVDQLDLKGKPELLPGWQPYGFDVE